ncbi:hypothetical protein L209DRAFT_96363 [Thermothelomyces heterothallicus CBS 203.75]
MANEELELSCRCPSSFVRFSLYIEVCSPVMVCSYKVIRYRYTGRGSRPQSIVDCAYLITKVYPRQTPRGIVIPLGYPNVIIYSTRRAL